MSKNKVSKEDIKEDIEDSEEPEEDLEEILEDLEIDETSFNDFRSSSSNPSLGKIAIASEGFTPSLEVQTFQDTKEMIFSNNQEDDLSYISKINEEEDEKKYISYTGADFSERVSSRNLDKFEVIDNDSQKVIDFRPTTQPNFSNNSSVSAYELPDSLEKKDVFSTKSQRDFIDSQKIDKKKYKTI